MTTRLNQVFLACPDCGYLLEPHHLACPRCQLILPERNTRLIRANQDAHRGRVYGKNRG